MSKIVWLVGGVSLVLLFYGLYGFVRKNGFVDLLSWAFIFVTGGFLSYFTYQLYVRGGA